jgi:hypothetical protein
MSTVEKSLLFPEFVRTRKKHLKRGELLFDFYNQCARSGYDEFRGFLNTWISQFPKADRIELISRMSRGGDSAFQAGLTELVVHAAIKKLRCDVVVHPTIEGTNKRPDFGIVDGDKIICYVEVTTVNVAADVVGGKNRETPLYNAIDKTELPAGCVLGYELIHAGGSSPRLRPLLKSIEEWAKKTVEEAKKGPVTQRFTTSDWEIELDLFAGGSKEKYDHSIGVSSGGAGWIAPHLDLRHALNLKSRRYGKLQTPYLTVVADAKGQLFGADTTRSALTEAVLGDETVQWREGDAAKVVHANNGFWRGREKSQNTHVSGVMLFPDTGLWGLRSDNLQPILAINPWADHALPDVLKVFSRYEAEDDKWIFKKGTNIADILGFPTPWPPEEGSAGR